MGTIEERNNKFYTEKGLNALIKRMETFIEFFNEGKFKYNIYILGFGPTSWKSKEELLSKITELGNLTGNQWELKKEIIKNDDGSENTMEMIK